MGRRNSFKPESLRSTKAYEKMEHGDKIIWEERRLTEIEKYTNICNDEKSSYTIYKDYKIIGYFEINRKLKSHIDKETKYYAYLITDTEYRDLYISIVESNPIYWYKMTRRKEFYSRFTDLYERYNPERYEEYECESVGYIGTSEELDLTVEDIEDYLVMNENTEFLIWGSYWRDNPFREIYRRREVKSKENIMMMTQAIRQQNRKYWTSNRSRFTKSIIKVASYNGILIMSVRYKPYYASQIANINKKGENKYPLDMPIDVIMAIISLPYKSWEELMTDDISKENVMAAIYMTREKEEMKTKLLRKLEQLDIEANDETVKNARVLLLREMKTTKEVITGILKELKGKEETREEIKEKLIDETKRRIKYIRK